MEVIRVYPAGNPYPEETRIRKTIKPEIILSFEETLGDNSKTTVITHQEVFAIDLPYDEFVEKLEVAKIIDTDGRIEY